LLRFADRVVAVSENDANIFSKIIPKEKITIIHNPVRLDKFYCAKKNPNTFVFVGRLSRNKRLDLLIEAFASASQNKEAMLYIVGSDFENLRLMLEEKVKKLRAEDRVKFLGALSEQELIELLASTDFFISASEYEGFGISAIEGMASGCIPVLSNIPSFRAFVEEGKNGFLLDFQSKRASKKLAQIMELSQAEKEELRKNAMAYAKRFESKEQTKKLLTLYSQLYNERR
jgi:alpha-1,3-mannosyltransferase